MTGTNLSQIMELKEKSLVELQVKHQELFPDRATPSNNKVYLWRKIAYRLQELEYGGFSAEVKSKLEEFIRYYDPINNQALRPTDITKKQHRKWKLERDKRLPIPGTVIIKNYKGTKLEVKVLDSGFEHNNKIYKTLSSIASEITGNHWSGYTFFNL